MNSVPDQRTTIQCGSCKQQLRLPINRGKLQVTCPKCSYSFEWEPAANQDIFQSFENVFSAPQDNTTKPSNSTASKSVSSSEENTKFIPWSDTIILGAGLIAVPLLITYEYLDRLQGFLLGMGIVLCGIYIWVRARTPLKRGLAILVSSAATFGVVISMGIVIAMFEKIDVDLVDFSSSPTPENVNDPFRGRTKRNTNVQQLDALMEKW